MSGASSRPYGAPRGAGPPYLLAMSENCRPFPGRAAADRTEQPVKFLVIGVVALFLGYWIVQDPSSLADLCQEGLAWTWDMTQTVFGGIIDFAQQLLS